MKNCNRFKTFIILIGLGMFMVNTFLYFQFLGFRLDVKQLENYIYFTNIQNKILINKLKEEFLRIETERVKPDLERYLKANVIICNKTVNGLGSGTIVKIKDNYYIFSVAHLIKEVEDEYVLKENNKSYRLELIAYNFNYDLSLFKVPEDYKIQGYLEISDRKQLLSGEIVYVVGNPTGWEDCITMGTIVKVSFENYFFITSAKAWMGNSGGAVILNGKLVGVLRAILTKFKNILQTENYSIAVNLDTIKKFLKEIEL